MDTYDAGPDSQVAAYARGLVYDRLAQISPHTFSARVDTGVEVGELLATPRRSPRRPDNATDREILQALSRRADSVIRHGVDWLWAADVHSPHWAGDALRAARADGVRPTIAYACLDLVTVARRNAWSDGQRVMTAPELEHVTLSALEPYAAEAIDALAIITARLIEQLSLHVPGFRSCLDVVVALMRSETELASS